MRKRRVTQAATATWGADSVVSTDLERTGLITQLDVTIEITPSATLDGANQPDGIFRLIGNMRVYGGSHTYFSLPAVDGAMGGVLQHSLNVLDGFGPGHGGGDVAAPSAAYVPVNTVFHAGSRPRDKWGRINPYDLSAFIPAHAETQLQAEWTMYGNDVADDTVTIASAVAAFTIHRVTGTDAEIQAEMARQEVAFPRERQSVTGMIPAWAATVHANAGTTSDFNSETINVPAGGYMKRIGIAEQDAVATVPNRSSDQLTEIALRNNKTGIEFVRAHIESWLSELPISTPMGIDDVPDFGGGAPEGIVPIDLRPMTTPSNPFGNDYGFDMRRADSGDWVLGLLLSTRAAGDDTLVLWERYQQTEAPLSPMARALV